MGGTRAESVIPPPLDFLPSILVTAANTAATDVTAAVRHALLLKPAVAYVSRGRAHREGERASEQMVGGCCSERNSRHASRERPWPTALEMLCQSARDCNMST